MRPLPRGVLRPFQEFAKLESASGILLLACTSVALVWSNSRWGDTYLSFWGTELAVTVGKHGLAHSLIEWINDGLMAVFFLVVGLEIKREMLVGELSSPRRASLPILAAAGGMVVPAVIYSLLNGGTEAARGWGVPVATDIAFSLGALSLLGRRVPLGLKVFLAAFAIADDLGAVLVIALFYTGELSTIRLAFAGTVLVLLVLANASGLRHSMAYLLPGLLLWLALLGSGVHATITGVLLAFTIPARDDGGGAEGSLLRRLEQALHPWVSFLILPVFALANAGVDVVGELVPALSHPVTLGVVLGLVIGKPIGIFSLSYLSVRARLAELPSGVSWSHLLGAGMLGGIGFTMALFVAHLAFGDSDLLDRAKVGVLLASVVAGAAGLGMLHWTAPRAKRVERAGR